MQIDASAAIVTGAASGLGLATARMLALQGARVALLDIDAARVAEAAAGLGDRALGLQCDVGDAASAEQAVGQAVAAHGRPRILVSCAGIATGKRIVGRDGPMPLAEFERVIQVNLIGTFNLLRLVAAEMTQLEPDPQGERGAIVNTASVAAFDGQIGQAAYAASKGGVAALTLPAARELARHGIRVVTIAPGIFETPMLRGLPADVQQALGDSVPFPKRLGRPGRICGPGPPHSREPDAERRDDPSRRRFAHGAAIGAAGSVQDLGHLAQLRDEDPDRGLALLVVLDPQQRRGVDGRHDMRRQRSSAENGRAPGSPESSDPAMPGLRSHRGRPGRRA